MGIGQVNDKGDVTILVIRSPQNSVTEAERNEFARDAHPRHTQGQIQEQLGYMGYNSVLIDLKRNGDKYVLSQQSVNKLHQEFDPMKVAFLNASELLAIGT